MPLGFEPPIKGLLDRLPTGTTRLMHDGETVAVGYKPDRIYRRNGMFWVIEIESTTSRKGFIGGYLKAQKYFQDEHQGKGRLLFIINREKRNLEAIGRQITQYHDWLKANGISVQPTYLMYHDRLNGLVKNKVDVLSRIFLKKADFVIR